MLTIRSPHLTTTLGRGLFVLEPTRSVFTTVKLPKAVYDSCTKAQLENRFGQVTAYQHLNGTPHAAKPQLRTQSRKIQGPEVSGPWLIAEKSALVYTTAPVNRASAARDAAQPPQALGYRTPLQKLQKFGILPNVSYPRER